MVKIRIIQGLVIWAAIDLQVDVGGSKKAHTHKEVILLPQGGIVKRLCRSAFSLPFNGRHP